MEIVLSRVDLRRLAMVDQHFCVCPTGQVNYPAVKVRTLKGTHERPKARVSNNGNRTFETDSRCGLPKQGGRQKEVEARRAEAGKAEQITTVWLAGGRSACH